jgi:phosphatidylglycerophosphatase A
MEMRTFKRAVIICIAEDAYAGRSPIAPGTAGTIVGVFLYLLLNGLPLPWYLAACSITFGIGIWAAGEAEKLLGKKDAQSIVIDEIAGYLISMAMVPSGWGAVVAGFFLFRLFDIVKPWPLKKLQDFDGGLGVMLDDLGAGVYTNAVLQIAVLVINIINQG